MHARIRAVAVSVLAVAALLVVPANPAVAASCVKATTTGASTCFYPTGEKVTVTDTKADGRRAGARLWFRDEEGYDYTRLCQNTGGHNTTVTCDYDFPEGWYVRMYPGTCDGSAVDCSVASNWKWGSYEVAYT